ncbi:flavodoxin family protein [Geomonas azotofigens]|uniref:flavodoxin family protein n=1 Tax=Geomonas azotofigens TaxID=2843196 RepID=UPI001C106859|nr:flavodoxin family protein [Geomonas azotofigens]MBU5612990.1 flavodoxin family protein [Geomonas azotofigens]
MSKNILLLTGSPRKGGNTDKLADAFTTGAERAGHTVVRYRTADKNIKGCVDCKTCFSKGTACSFADDFNELAPLYQQADVVVFATPLYWFSFPVQLKAAIDKLYAFLIGDRPLKIKECLLLASGGDKEERKFEGLVKSYQLIAEFLGWQDRGVLVVPGLHDKDDVVKTEGLRQAEALGQAIA